MQSLGSSTEVVTTNLLSLLGYNLITQKSEEETSIQFILSVLRSFISLIEKK